MPLSDEQIDVAWLSADDSITTYEHFRRHVARAIESAAIDDFLARTGKYLTNDASREAAIADATAPLLAQIAELEEKVKAAEQASRWESDLCEQALDSMKQLEAQLAEARKDAERLDWLDEQNSELENDTWVVLGHDCTAEDDYKKYWVGADLRTAIDAVIAQEQ